MGTTSAAVRVDGAVLRQAAGDYDAAAEMLAATVRTHLSERAFGVATAGRDHARDAAALGAALDDLTAALRLWSRAAHEVAAALRDSADRYADADLQAAERVG
jgi:hypothetical protein